MRPQPGHRQPDPGDVPSLDEAARRLAGQAVSVEYFARIDRRDVDGAVALYAPDAVFIGARGQEQIRAVMARGLAANAGHRSRHVVANLTSTTPSTGLVVVRYVALAYTLPDSGPPQLRTALEQEMHLAPDGDGRLRIIDHRIFGFDPDGLEPEAPN